MPAPALLDALTQEVALACDAQGRVTWADGRARERLGAEEGLPLARLCPPGVEEKAQALVREALGGRVEGWELPLLVRGAPVTLRFTGGPDGAGGALLVGNPMPEDATAALRQVGEAMDEVVSLNREVVRQKRELERRQQELLRLNRELEESNRGVLALHAELAEKAEALQRAADVRGRVVANVSHEFRSPLHTILGLAKLLQSGTDGALAEEQARQVHFIRTCAEELSALVNDMLDLSKAEAGKFALHSERFAAAELVGAMRGMFRPLVPADRPVALVVEDAPEGLAFETDRSKVGQVLRNLVSNALKFTERGEVRVRMEAGAGGRVAITVRDTGIGIAPEHLERVFEEFGQIDSPLQRASRGTGLGMPLSRKLAELLGGSLTVTSTPGEGSTFHFTLPAVLPEVQEVERLTRQSREAGAPGQAPILVVEDDRKTLLLYAKYLSLAGFPVVTARSVAEAREQLKAVRPAAVVLDIMLEDESSWGFLADLKKDPATHDVPVLVVTISGREQKARALGADEFWLKPLDPDRLIRKLRTFHAAGVGGSAAETRLLVIDDDESARYLLRRLLKGTPYTVLEAATCEEAMRLAREKHPRVIFLDFQLRGETAFDVLDALKADPATRSIPVIIQTAYTLDEGQRQRLAALSEDILSKEALSRELAINRIRDALSRAGVRPGGPGRA
jgi:signal transduction histidine kinase/CheY-like chemotaxis protein